ncbi:MAG: hypothetical protein LAO55_20735 [Acidobacteriia bacterium]|nr:hypothetical protein [Terriglobia bacterium]
MPSVLRLAIHFLLYGSIVFAQTPPPKPTPKQAPPQSAYLTKPLSLSVDILGPSFKGHDIVAIIADLKRSPLGVPKSEFETTRQYEQRIESLLASKSRQYVFAQVEFTEAIYDADEKIMNVSVTAPVVFGLFDSDIHMVNDPTGDSTYFSSHLELRSLRRSTTQYVATNGFGVKINVTHFTSDEFGVVIDKSDTLFADIEPCCDHFGTRKAVLSLDMDVSNAKALKPFLQVALVCTLVNPTVYEGTDGRSPTISSPIETTIKQQYLLVHPDELWLYDLRTGHVLGKFSPK